MILDLNMAITENCDLYKAKTYFSHSRIVEVKLSLFDVSNSTQFPPSCYSVICLSFTEKVNS